MLAFKTNGRSGMRQGAMIFLHFVMPGLVPGIHALPI